MKKCKKHKKHKKYEVLNKKTFGCQLLVKKQNGAKAQKTKNKK